MGARGDRGRLVHVAVVDPDELRREGLATIAERSSRLRVAASAAAVADLPELKSRAVAFVAMPRGAWSAERALASVPTIVHGDSLSDAQVLRALGGGAAGVLRTPCSTLEIEHAAVAVADGGTFIDPRLAARVIAMAFRGHPGRGQHGLTAQERRVLALLPRGLTNREIGKELGVSHETVKTHLRNACKKLGVSDRYEAAKVVEETDIGAL